ncbi:hypothetical protein K491DRAFT_780188 [Lophiostoma macrostomum CBS 122681]|uniref:Uncharacterized protein n=1 Tax=Lophiostoma macrostomum CBS 122681 TaxID=1314788 RepID=A0A6A6T478_9PLEO|nr:hypothetical protein K491DRAFT_780188 [Lophiostoma macrostomum CBS 122681]
MPSFQAPFLDLAVLLIPLYTRSTSPVHIALHTFIVTIITSILVFFNGRPVRAELAKSVSIAVLWSKFLNRVADATVIGEWNRLILLYALSWNYIWNLNERLTVGTQSKASLIAQLHTRISHSTILVIVHPAIEGALLTYLFKDCINTGDSMLHAVSASLALWMTFTTVMQDIDFWVMDALDDDCQAKVVVWCNGILHTIYDMTVSIPDIVDHVKERLIEWAYSVMAPEKITKPTEEKDAKKVAGTERAYWPVARDHEWQVLVGESVVDKEGSTVQPEASNRGGDNKDVFEHIETTQATGSHSLIEDNSVATGTQFRPSTRRRG